MIEKDDLKGGSLCSELKSGLEVRRLADERDPPELHDLADETYRSSPVKRAANKSAPLTSELAEEIRTFVAKNPKLHQRDVAQRFNVNPGRVSEALNHQI